MATPYDSDGAGDWTVAGLHTLYTPDEWERQTEAFHGKDHRLRTKLYGLHMYDSVPTMPQSKKSLWYRITEWWFAL